MSMIHRAAAVAAIALVAGIYHSGGTAQTVPRFEIDAKWPKDLPGDWITGRLGGVCMDAKGDNVFVVNRAGHHRRGEGNLDLGAGDHQVQRRPATWSPPGATRRRCRARSTAASSISPAMSGSPATATP